MTRVVAEIIGLVDRIGTRKIIYLLYPGSRLRYAIFSLGKQKPGKYPDVRKSI